jgi:hypothetical protein
MTESAVSIDDTRTRMFRAIRSRTLQNLIIVYRSWQEDTSEKGGLAALTGSITAPPTGYIMQLLKCSRRSTHDYRLTIQFLMQEDIVIGFFKEALSS